MVSKSLNDLRQHEDDIPHPPFARYKRTWWWEKVNYNKFGPALKEVTGLSGR